MGGRSAGPRPGPAAGVPTGGSSTGGSSPAGGRQCNSGQGRGGWRRAPVGGLHPGRPPPFGRQHRPGCALPRRLTGHQPGLLLPRGVSGSLEWLQDLRHTCSRPTRQGPSLRASGGKAAQVRRGLHTLAGTSHGARLPGAPPGVARPQRPCAPRAGTDKTRPPPPGPRAPQLRGDRRVCGEARASSHGPAEPRALPRRGCGNL